ncbi:helix-turn-helix transcriptional regulator [Streptomyces cylindrosporus]|uniref:LuxR C-terminal-related transcriptional regulator n=1 Tax=Streptomyces cylindrosporus TaxID=2927583 RepID=A0ABS9YML0_9ACTN|nr:LuxR family transcriptional regulator [Streptomyces cylindrosporus]MCI3278498.1 LuxR C-terminal-related transcriptional regulator [Streptomyces cylindrosporus]
MTPVNPPPLDRTSPPQRTTPLPEGVRVRVLHAVYGDPRAAAELVPLLTERQSAGLDPLPTEPAELAPALLRAHRAEIRALPDDTRLLLLLAAADQYPVATHAFLRAVTAARLDTRPLEAAESAGLAHAGPGGVVFRDAWTRIAAYESGSPADRRDVHRLLARVLSGEGETPRRSWHRGAGALGPSARLAAELRTAADRARASGQLALSRTLLERAATLCPDPLTQSHLRTRAATDAWHAGDADRARRLAATGTSDDALAGLFALRAGNAMEAFDGLVAGAVRRVEALGSGVGPGVGAGSWRNGSAVTADSVRGALGADADPPVGPAPAHRIPNPEAAHLLARATEAAIYTGDLRRCRDAVRISGRLGVAPPGLLGGLAAAVDGRYEDARRLLVETAGRCGPGDDPTLLVHAGIAALMLGDHTRASTATVRAAASARARGATATVVQALEFRAYADFWTGRPHAGAATATDALRQAHATGQDNGACHLQAALAMFAAVTGDEAGCRDRAATARSYALARGLGLPAALAQWALAFLDLADGRFAAASARLRALAGFGPGHGHRAIRHLATPHYVEAAVRTGDTRVARAAHADYHRWATAVRSPDDLALSARCRALLAPGAEAVDHYREALDLHAGGTRDFERARTELLFGGALRRLRRRTEARDRLHSALEAFDCFGAPHCAAQARAELRALGTPATPTRTDDPTGRLTAQQHVIARMAADGATNREIAARLALSPRTIDHHLRGVFSRLGIRSRIELVRLLGAGEDPA